MFDYILSCCSTADLTEDFYRDRNVSYICFHFNMDGKQYADDLGKSMAFDEFYKRIENGAAPTTSQVNVEEYREYFENFLKQGRDVLHITLSSGISGTYNSANIAASELREEYPDRKIYIVDSLSASSGFGLLMDMLADRRDAGADIDELKDYASELRYSINQWFFSTDLTSYLRGGRISRTAFTVGKVLGICPLLHINREGKLIPTEKIRTKKKAMEAIVQKMEELADNGKSYSGKCYISQSAISEDAGAVADMIRERFRNIEYVKVNSIGTVIGAHTGPGTIAVFFKGRERS